MDIGSELDRVVIEPIEEPGATDTQPVSSREVRLPREESKSRSAGTWDSLNVRSRDPGQLCSPASPTPRCSRHS